jgi:cell division protein FtsN
MAQRKKKRRSVKKRRTAKKRRTRTTRSQHDYPGWVWMLFGLAIGLAVAFAVYVKDRTPDRTMVAGSEQPAAPAGDVVLDDNNETPSASSSAPPERFNFYNMLPNFEVVIPEEEPEVEVDREPRAVERPGVYVLQAGSFTDFDDADRRRAQLALQGIESRIQRVSIDDKTYHRVRIGPIDDLDELNLTRSRLRQANIDVLRIRLGD